ncbi:MULTISPECIES: TetR/AcrR family transcriptional regulator [Actinomadura]|uniref:TetR/AcrR family transcriptional regulator n=1 Tax=Actinomadura TaxID=1988 RepID=UPI0031E99615
MGILDAEGHQGLSMRRVATELGVTAGALYWYVANKGEMLELALDAVLGEISVPAPDVEWRRALADLAGSHRRMLLRHPWVLTDLAAQPNLGPNALALSEAGLSILVRAGFADADLDAALAAVNDHVVGAVSAELAWRAAMGPAEGGPQEWAEQMDGYLRRLRAEHPLLAGRMAAASGVDVHAESERRFGFALECLLDGLAARLPHS